ncbi:unnamed protein product [Rotaria magnacalcarata]|uniref:Uncharacterized protein n=1 Tax=Rotaria magnacalcarata TaxID=392030 RepID=A0A819DM06_9BILA|nr:unnamed protein product [Rotaria magnacalcarata]CAF3830608.1 unnamed protein product [Rotaria magnacalcarata]
MDEKYRTFDRMKLEELHRLYREQCDTMASNKNSSTTMSFTSNITLDKTHPMLEEEEEDSYENETNADREQETKDEQTWKLLIQTYQDHVNQLELQKKTES